MIPLRDQNGEPIEGWDFTPAEVKQILDAIDNPPEPNEALRRTFQEEG